MPCLKTSRSFSEGKGVSTASSSANGSMYTILILLQWGILCMYRDRVLLTTKTTTGAKSNSAVDVTFNEIVLCK